MDDSPITLFVGPYEFLSNFYPSPIYDRHRQSWSTVEHAFQGLKSLNPIQREWVRSALTPAEAKRRGRQVTLRLDWEKIKLDVMHMLVRLKFEQHPPLALQLLATGDREIIEGNTWGDRFWGQYAGEGQNHLGRILMLVREEIGSAQGHPPVGGPTGMDHPSQPRHQPLRGSR